MPVSTPKEDVSERKTTAKAERKTITNWGVFDKAGLVAQRVTCNGYLSSHPSDMTCHSNLLSTSESIQHHMLPEHGGGWFFFKLRHTDAKGKSTLWRDLEAGGVEIQHLYCPHCRKEVSMTPRDLNYHLGPHPGATRQNVNPSTLCMTLGYNHPETEDSFEDEEGFE
jgi:hypothetical protein